MKSSLQLNYFSSNVRGFTTLHKSRQEPKEITQRLLKNFVYNQKISKFIPVSSQTTTLSPDHPDQQSHTTTTIYLHVGTITTLSKVR